MGTITLSSKIKKDDIVEKIISIFDYSPVDDVIEETINIPTFPSQYQIGLVVGSSGSGKSTLLHNVFGCEKIINWDNTKSIASNFETFEDASSKFGAVGLNSIPTWLKPYNVLSNGEKFRADLARRLENNAVIDEFTSVVNREVAKSCCMSLKKYIKQYNLKNITFASCHDDIIPYLEPDWIYNTDTCKFYNGRYLCRPQININIYSCEYKIWEMFKRYHYLSGDINKSARCYLGTYENIPVAFCAVLSMPSGSIKHAFREHRVVVLPDYQGMGIGNRFSEAIAEIYHKAGGRYFSKTANPRMGIHRDNSDLWKPTSKNHILRSDYLKYKKNYHNMSNNLIVHANRDCFSHEYVGDGIEYQWNGI